MHFELEEAARELVSRIAGDDVVAWPNVAFTPPADGSPYLKFDYMPAISEPVSLDRKCRYYVGIVQVSVIFQPEMGTRYAREVAKTFCAGVTDGLELTDGYVYNACEVFSIISTDTGLSLPMRFKVRAEEHRQ